ncbi:hypothetical protein COT04_00730 [Candidatus Shapirobacteria bacterium CG07_land_8_20_14_0_80_39_12]|uniref:Four helix bundle protein n=1 Tax=Candidatus Shapirobacteria bacterium CG07_land_8_20_14_0_80_39_12 TaxID=1974480 RepID=A0A2M6YQ83_9BACT|nr:MAG: hypothetical protein COT04_00730 [Candidatus Shapirobacteria bacterium CG07_land_8_20_14_0_80_39_12]
MTQFPNNYDLEERTAKFGEEIIEFCKSLKQDAITKPIISQRLRMMAKCVPEMKEEIRSLWRECQELTLIFQKITSSLKKNN